MGSANPRTARRAGPRADRPSIRTAATGRGSSPPGAPRGANDVSTNSDERPDAAGLDWSSAEIGRYALKPGQRSEVRVDGAVGYSLRRSRRTRCWLGSPPRSKHGRRSSPRLRPADLREPSPLTGTMPPVARDWWAQASSLPAQLGSATENRSRPEDAPRSELPKRDLRRHLSATNVARIISARRPSTIAPTPGTCLTPSSCPVVVPARVARSRRAGSWRGSGRRRGAGPGVRRPRQLAQDDDLALETLEATDRLEPDDIGRLVGNLVGRQLERAAGVVDRPVPQELVPETPLTPDVALGRRPTGQDDDLPRSDPFVVDQPMELDPDGIDGCAPGAASMIRGGRPARVTAIGSDGPW